ncbi:MAG: response regulator [Melioribacteraceae bacterium]|nr:response regulator [Melioribacteraceae bacterium]
MMLKRVLAIDDEENYLKSVKKILEMYGFSTLTISNPRNVLEIIQAQDFNAILLDVRMPGLNGIEVISNNSKNSPLTPVIIVSGQSSIDIAVDFIKNGAYDFLDNQLMQNAFL